MPPRANRGGRGGGGQPPDRGGGGGGGRGGVDRGGSRGGGPGGGGGWGNRGGRGRGGPGGGPPPPSPTPSSAPSTTGSAGPRGRGGGPAIRGGRGRGRGFVATGSTATTIDPAATAIGVKRPGYGTAGRVVPAVSNMYKLEIPKGIIYHYDDIAGEKTLPVVRNMELFKQLQHEIAPEIFSPKISYDGRKNAVSSHRLKIPDDYKEFPIPIVGGNPDKPPRIVRIKIKLVNQINPILLTRFTEGKQSNDNMAITSLQALNIVLRMEPTQRFPFNVRSFFTPEGKQPIAGGIELWRGYFQSVRPAQNKLVVNVDVSAGVMFQPGPLISLCCKFLRRPESNPSFLANLSDRDRLELRRFLSGLKIHAGQQQQQNGRPRAPRSITDLTRQSASQLTFRMNRDGQPETTISVANYFRTVVNRPLQFPNFPCVQVGSGKALLPLEICTVPAGQIMRKQVPPDATRDMVEFSAQRPNERFNAIHKALQELQYGQSDYVRQFGMSVSTQPIQLAPRVLQAPTMRYGAGSKQATVVVRNGAWNMADKHFITPMPLDSWAVMVLEGPNRFQQRDLDNMVKGLQEAAIACGMTPVAPPKVTSYRQPQRGVANLLTEMMNEIAKKREQVKIIVVVLPFNGDAIWAETKYWGDICTGVATQCLKADKCRRANIQYWANVCLKLNGKLGGINTIADPQQATIISDPHYRTLVLGADVIHPSPGSVGRPSFTAMVGNVDRHAAKYIATSRAQTSRQEIIDDFGGMAKEIIEGYADYRRVKEGKSGAECLPSRIIVYRDGVSEGQFEQVRDLELPKLIDTCKSMKITPAITFIIVGKRHHFRMKPVNPRDEDRSGNMPAGTVVDTEIAHPIEFDFYLQSHAGLKGTSRSAHYSVIYDDNKFNADTLYQFTYILCHVYARATRSVSIPAPTYYADIVCSRAKTHYNPGVDMSAASETASTTAGNAAEQHLQSEFRQVHAAQKRRMYFQ